MSDLFSKITNIDKNISSLFHKVVMKPKFLEFLLLPFGYVFSPFCVPFLVLLVGYKIPHSIDKEGNM